MHKWTSLAWLLFIVMKSVWHNGELRASDIHLIVMEFILIMFLLSVTSQPLLKQGGPQISLHYCNTWHSWGSLLWHISLSLRIILKLRMSHLYEWSCTMHAQMTMEQLYHQSWIIHLCDLSSKLNAIDSTTSTFTKYGHNITTPVAFHWCLPRIV